MPKISLGKSISKPIQPVVAKPATAVKPVEAKPQPPKAPAQPSNPKPQPKSKPREVPYESKVRALADAADREAMRAQDLLRFPERLTAQGIDPNSVSHGMAYDADKLNRQLINELLAPYKR